MVLKEGCSLVVVVGGPFTMKHEEKAFRQVIVEDGWSLICGSARWSVINVVCH